VMLSRGALLHSSLAFSLKARKNWRENIIADVKRNLTITLVQSSCVVKILDLRLFALTAGSHSTTYTLH